MTAPQNQDLTGSIALVTGATSGIGRAVAFQLAARGAEVVVHGRNVNRGVQVVEEIELGGGHARFAAADLDDPSAITRLVAEIGEVDILVNVAGHATWAPTAQLGAEAFDGMFASNVRAPFLLVAAIAPSMASRGKGSVITIGSMAGSLGLVNGAAYGATKAALASLTQSWAAEFGTSGVRFNLVAPGPVYTREESRDLFDALGDTTAMKRAAQPEEIAEVVGFLASPRASYMTGAIVAVDGGRTAI